tara:strand:+ start:73 stop:735 length:663 start_codon:yes stop_codon:yes gene_type:complete
MTTQIMCEMSKYLSQMADLQMKMERLQREKNEIITQDNMKQQEVEPNLKLMSNWLETHGDVMDVVHRDNEIIRKYRKLEDLGTSKVNIINVSCKLHEELCSVDTTSSSKMIYTNQELEQIFLKYGLRYNSKVDVIVQIQELLDMYGVTREEHEIYKNKEIIRQQFSEQRLHNVTTFQNYNNIPNYFMKQFIEATHNLFVIQQERIGELEEKINTMNNSKY